MKGAPPVAQAMITCDYVVQDCHSQKYTLAGIFNYFQAVKLPLTVSFHTYICLVDGRGDMPALLRMVNNELNKEIFSARMNIVFGAPLSPLEIIVTVNQIQLEAFGTYALEFVVGSEVLAMRQLSLRPIRLDSGATL